MKKISVILGTAAIMVTAGIIACDSGKMLQNNEGIAELNGPMDRESMINRGRYLVTIMGCNDCHSPKRWDHTDLNSIQHCCYLAIHQKCLLPTYHRMLRSHGYF